VTCGTGGSRSPQLAWVPRDRDAVVRPNGMGRMDDLPAGPEAGPFVHPAVFYRGAAEYLAATVPFVRRGLAAGDPVAVALPPANLALLRNALGADAGRVQMYDMTEVGRNPGRILPEVLLGMAESHPDRHVRIIGEPIWPGRTAQEYSPCVQHEALINHAFHGRSATVLCPYDASRLDPVALADAAQTHPVLIEGGVERRSHDYAPERVLDRMNEPLPTPLADPFPFDASSLSAARRFAAVAAERAGLNGDRLDDFVLAIGELAANSVRHGGGRGVLHVWTEDGALAGELRDAGRLAGPLAGRRPVTLTSLGGQGLLMVQQVADLVRTHVGAEGATTRIHLRLAAAA
jgi:anti-sigma regulatory factor (Ser/Thr protein kinase)